MNLLQDLDISTEGQFEKQIFNPFDFQKVLIDEVNDPDINFFNDKSEIVESSYFSIDEFNSRSEKPLTNYFLSPICIKKGSLRATPKIKKPHFFGRNDKSRSSSFRNFLLYQNIICFD